MQLYVTTALLAVAGAALVLQNALMVRVTDRSSTIIITLLLNSASGFVLLLTLLYFKSGSTGINEAIQKISPTTLLMGLLGSFFVFAGIVGYKNLGAATTIAILVASQLAFGLLWDVYYNNAPKPDLKTLAGVVCLLVGVVLLVQRKG